MTTIEILKKARELLSDPARWCQNDYARDNNHSVDWNASSAKCWCPSGAILKSVYAENVESLEDPSLIALASTLPDVSGLDDDGDRAIDAIAQWNDAPERTHAEVLQRFDEAIARLEAAG